MLLYNSIVHYAKYSVLAFLTIYNAQKLCLRIMLALLCSMFCLPIKYALNYAGTVYNWCRPNTCKTFLQCLTLDGIRNINTCD